LSDTITWTSAAITLFVVLLVNELWNYIGPDLVAVFSALVQTGITTRLVLLGLFFGLGIAIFALRRWKQVWYGHAVCVVGARHRLEHDLEPERRDSRDERAGADGCRLQPRPWTRQYRRRTRPGSTALLVTRHVDPARPRSTY
jgi:hypothetical protein